MPRALKKSARTRTKKKETTKADSAKGEVVDGSKLPDQDVVGPSTGAPSSTPPPSTTLPLHLPSGISYSIAVGPEFRRMAMYWEYVLRNRIRWLKNESAAKSLTQRCVEALGKLGLDSTKLAAIAAAGAVEIEIPYRIENEGWEFRIFPWEFLLGTATEAQRRGKPLIVIRHICPKTTLSPPQPPKKLMVVESAPGALGDIYTFTSERRLVQANLGLTKTVCPANPTKEELAERVAKEGPDIIHLAGVDSHEAVSYTHLTLPTILRV